MDKEINNNGFDYIDLELPSGTLWATCNVGANKPSDYGLYFQWGDTKGYAKSQIGKGKGKKMFEPDWSDYKFGVNPNFTKYTTLGTTLDLEDDAAHIHMGGDWHIPVPIQIRELLSNTTSEWRTQDGVNGRLFVSKSNPSKSIFIPAEGNAWGGFVNGSEDVGYVWSSSLSAYGVVRGQDFYFDSKGIYLDDGSSRYNGLSVRGVIDKKMIVLKKKKII